MITNDRIDTSGPAQRRRLDSYDARKGQNMRDPSLSAEIEMLREALEPFAKAELFLRPHDDHLYPETFNGLTAEDFRRARQALNRRPE